MYCEKAGEIFKMNNYQNHCIYRVVCYTAGLGFQHSGKPYSHTDIIKNKGRLPLFSLSLTWSTAQRVMPVCSISTSSVEGQIIIQDLECTYKTFITITLHLIAGCPPYWMEGQESSNLIFFFEKQQAYN